MACLHVVDIEHVMCLYIIDVGLHLGVLQYIIIDYRLIHDETQDFMPPLVTKGRDGMVFG